MPAVADAQSNAELLDLVRKQANQIADLTERLAALERAQHDLKGDRSQLARRQSEDHDTLIATKASLPRVLPDGVRPTPAADMTTAEVKARIDEKLASRIGTTKPDITAEWGQGAPILRSADGYWSFKVRGRILMDASTSTGSRYAARDITTTGSRALRLGIEGGVGDHFFYQFETDFANDQVAVLTAYMGYRANLGHYSYDVRAGNLFNDRGYEGGTASDKIPFLERNVVANTIVPQRGYYGTGVQGRLYGKDWHLSLTVTGNDVHASSN